MKRKIVFLVMSFIMAFGAVMAINASESIRENGEIISLQYEQDEIIWDLYEPTQEQDNLYFTDEDVYVSEVDDSVVSILDRLSDSGCYIAELQDLVTLLAIERQIDNSLYMGFTPYGDLRLNDEEITNDTRDDRLFELSRLFIEARKMQDTARGISRRYDDIVITLWAQPHEISNENFIIGFAREEYLALLDFVLEFANIDVEMVEVMIVGPIILGMGQQMDFNPYVTAPELEIELDLHYEPIEGLEIFGTVLRMGTPIWFQDPRTGTFRNMGTLGHPRDSSGRTAFGASHGIVPVGAAVFAGSNRVGTVIRSEVIPNSGIDVSYIRMEGFTVSSQIPFTGGHTQNFFATVPPSVPIHRLDVAMIVGSRNEWGRITSLSTSVNVRTPDGRIVPMRNVMTTDIRSQQFDSGAALISSQGGDILGTLIGGDGSVSAFSPAPNYQHIR